MKLRDWNLHFIRGPSLASSTPPLSRCALKYFQSQFSWAQLCHSIANVLCVIPICPQAFHAYHESCKIRITPPSTSRRTHSMENQAVTASTPSVQDAAEPAPKRRRRNTARACDHCKAKKTKCEGVQPCARCETHNILCTYDTPYSRGLAPPAVPPASRHHSVPTMRQSVPIPDHDMVSQLAVNDPGRAQERRESFGREASAEDEHVAERVEGVLGQSSNLAFSHAARLELSSRPPTPPESDVHAAGASSSAGFRATSSSYHGGDHNNVLPLGQSQPVHKKRSSHSGLYFSEPPFPELNLARYTLPPTERGLEMCSWYFENASPTYRFMHRPSVEKLVRKCCRVGEWLGGVASPDNDSTELTRIEECTVLMVWAMGCQYPMSRPGKVYDRRERDWLHQKGMEYFQVASMLLEKEKSLVDRLSVLQVRLLMCFYFLTTSRLKAAWDLFAIVKNMANNLDLNRTTHLNAGSVGQRQHAPLFAELRKRAFWAIYILDTYLSAMLGKSLTFDEKDIKIDHATLDDDQMVGHSPTSLPRPSITDGHISMMWAPSTHARLARIVRTTLRTLYVDPPSDFNTSTMDELARQIETWESSLPEFLRMRNSGGLLPVYARQSSVIRLAQQHALIMVYRPSLPLSGLSNEWRPRQQQAFEVGNQESRPPLGSRDVMRPYQDRCLDAAFVVCEIMTALLRKSDISGQLTGQYWLFPYMDFCAATVMLVYILHNPRLPRERESQIWDGVWRCCEVLKALVAENRLARRYLVALEVSSSHPLRPGAFRVATNTSSVGSLATREQTP